MERKEEDTGSLSGQFLGTKTGLAVLSQERFEDDYQAASYPEAHGGS